MKRFDSLVHVTRNGGWINGRDDASIARLRRELTQSSVERACLVGLPGVVDNAYVLECAAASEGALVPIAGFDPSADSTQRLNDEVGALAAAGFAGIKLHPRLNRFDPTSRACLDAIAAASSHGLVVFLDTLFRQPAHSTRHAADIIDCIAHECSGCPIVLLHGGGAALLEVAEVVRVHRALVLDLSFTLMHYAGSSVDADIRWVMERLDQRITIGSDMPEYTPAAAFERAARLADGLAPEKRENMMHRNLERLLAMAAPA